MPEESSMRIGDAERERAAEDVGEHFRAGRLGVHEYDERIAAVYAAHTEDDLRPIFADLPRAVTTHRPSSWSGPAAPRRTSIPLLLAKVAGLALLGLVVVAVVMVAVPFVLVGLLVRMKLSGQLCGGRGWSRAPQRFYRSRGWA